MTVSATASSRLDPAVLAAEERPRIWKAAWMMFEQAPVFGVGLRQFAWQHFVLNGQFPAPRVVGLTDHAHNLPLHVLAELGVVGLILLTGSAFLWVKGLLRQPRTAAHWWLWACALVLTVHSMLEYPLWYTFFLGRCRARPWYGRRAHDKIVFVQSSAAAVGCCWRCWVSAGWCWASCSGTIGFWKTFWRFATSTCMPPPEVKRQGEDLLREIRRTSVLAPYVWFGVSRAIEVNSDRLGDKLTVNTRAMRLFPTDDMVYREAMLLGLHGDDAQARRQWDLAAASFPEEEERALRVVQRRVDDGVGALAPLLEYANSRTTKQAQQ